MSALGGIDVDGESEANALLITLHATAITKMRSIRVLFNDDFSKFVAVQVLILCTDTPLIYRRC